MSICQLFGKDVEQSGLRNMPIGILNLQIVKKLNFDPLRYLIQEAHKLGIEVHPWFTLTLRQSDIFREFALPGTPKQAFDVHNPQFRELMSKLVEEVVTDNDVDGVNLDYVRAIGLCFNATCQEDYKKKYDRSLEKQTRWCSRYCQERSHP